LQYLVGRPQGFCQTKLPQYRNKWELSTRFALLT
jgi:hypothetical protein